MDHRCQYEKSERSGRTEDQCQTQENCTVNNAPWQSFPAPLPKKRASKQKHTRSSSTEAAPGCRVKELLWSCFLHMQLPGQKEEMLALRTSKDRLIQEGKVPLERKDTKELKPVPLLPPS